MSAMPREESENFDFSNNKSRRKRTNALVRIIKQNGTDNEFYPTDQRQIALVKADFEKVHNDYDLSDTCSFLDVGCGDGRILAQLAKGDKYGIEISPDLIQSLPIDVNLIGTNFFENSLIDKPVAVTFCNPPYSVFEAFAVKIIKESLSKIIYLVLPVRWASSLPIKQVLELRGFEATVLGSFDYLTADRAARAKVDVIRISTAFEQVEQSYRGHRFFNKHAKKAKDPFDIWFEENFPIDAPARDGNWKEREAQEQLREEKFRHSLRLNEGVIKTLVTLYGEEQDELSQAYSKITDIPHALFKELGVNVDSIKESIKLKWAGCKAEYWDRLFDELDSLTGRLTTATKNRLSGQYKNRANVDFTYGNASAIVMWAIQHANHYYDQQFIETFEKLSEQANVHLYKSNQKTIATDGWRYNKLDFDKTGAYSLDYRIVLEGVGGYDNYSYSNSSIRERAAALIDDLGVIANHVGFNTPALKSAKRSWQAGKSQSFYYVDADGQMQLLFDAKCFIKGTLHLRLNTKFIQKLNVVHGKLKGWVRSAEEAVEEMGVDIELAEESFNVNMRLGVKDFPMLGYSANDE